MNWRAQGHELGRFDAEHGYRQRDAAELIAPELAKLARVPYGARHDAVARLLEGYAAGYRERARGAAPPSMEAHARFGAMVERMARIELDARAQIDAEILRGMDDATLGAFSDYLTAHHAETTRGMPEPENYGQVHAEVVMRRGLRRHIELGCDAYCFVHDCCTEHCPAGSHD